MAKANLARASSKEELSAGTSSLTSVSRQGSSGTFPQDTESSHHSPALVAESLSGQDQQPSQQSFTAGTTGTSTQETTFGQPSLSVSSEESQQEREVTQGQGYSEEDPGSGGFLVP